MTSANVTVLQEILRLIDSPEDDFDWLRDRSGHERRYEIDPSKIRCELGWKSRHTDLASGLATTIEWCRDNESWWHSTREVAEARYAAILHCGAVRNSLLIPLDLPARRDRPEMPACLEPC